MNKISHTIKYIIIILCLITFAWSVKYIYNQRKWSPIDEYAHMDYIEKMREGMMPKLQYPVSDDIYKDLLNHPERCFTPPIHNREELGMGNYSYQAKHPPIYYAVLLTPDIVLKKLGYDAFQRLRILRMLSYLLFAIGGLFCVPICQQLKQKGFHMPEYYPWLGVLFYLLLATHQRYGLTNNMLSPLFINGALWLILKYHVSRKTNYLYWFMLVAGLSISVALTNVFIVPFLLLYALIIYIPDFSFKTFLTAISILLSTGLVILWWQLTTIPDKAFEEYIQNLLLAVIPANAITFDKFIDLLLNDSFQMSFINEKTDLSKTYLILLILNIGICLLLLKTLIKSNIWIIYNLCVFVIFIVTLYILNHYVPRVHWVALRNYLGFIPVIFISCSGFIVVISGKIKQKFA